MSVRVPTDPDGTPEPPAEVLLLPDEIRSGSAAPPGYDVMPGGERFVFRRGVRAPPPRSLLIKLNWLEELESTAAPGRQR